MKPKQYWGLLKSVVRKFNNSSFCKASLTHKVIHWIIRCKITVTTVVMIRNTQPMDKLNITPRQKFNCKGKLISVPRNHLYHFRFRRKKQVNSHVFSWVITWNSPTIKLAKAKIVLCRRTLVILAESSRPEYKREERCILGQWVIRTRWSRRCCEVTFPSTASLSVSFLESATDLLIYSRNKKRDSLEIRSIIWFASASSHVVI